MSKDDKKDKFLEKFIDFIYSNDIRKYLILILIAGIILRYIAVTHMSTIADEMIHSVHSMDIINSGVINHQNESPAYSYLTDIAYKIFGINAFSARFLSFFFGSLTIIIVFLIGKELYDEKIGLLASFFVAVSSYHIRYALMEMDEALIFFILLAFYFFIKEFKANKKISYISVILLGVSILIKPIALPFIASFALLVIFYYYENKSNKEILKSNKKRIINSVIILALFSAPILAYNYILYNQKGITDVIFSRFLGINREIYSPLQGYDESFDFSEVFTIAPKFVFETFIKLDPVLFIIGAIGILTIIFNKKYSSGKPFLLLFIIPLIFLMGASLLQTHFVPFVTLLSIPASVFVFFLSEKMSKVNPKTLFLIVALITISVNLYILYPHVQGKSAMFEAREYSLENIKDNDIVIVDSRIYRGRIAWMFNDKAYLEASYFTKMIEINNNLTSLAHLTDIYFVECAADDCGWGTIKDQPEFNKSMEEIVSFFKTNAQQEKIIMAGGGPGENTGYPNMIIYKTSAQIHPEVYSLIYQTHEWFYYPVRWAKTDWYDKYTPNGIFQILFHGLGKIMLWIAVIIALLSPIIIIAELFNIKKINDYLS